MGQDRRIEGFLYNRHKEREVLMSVGLNTFLRVVRFVAGFLCIFLGLRTVWGIGVLGFFLIGNYGRGWFFLKGLYSYREPL